MMWMILAVLSAVFAGVTAILAKCGIRKTDSDVATMIRTTVVLVFSWLMVWVTGAGSSLAKLEGKALVFLVLSGLATGASWICYFKALSMGDVNKVVPIDKSSTILTVLLAMVCFGETQRLALRLLCTAVLGVGIYMMVEKKQTEQKQTDEKWKLYAVLGAVFAALTSILAKVGISGVDSNVATAVRTCVVLVLAVAIVCVRGKAQQVKTVDRKELRFIILSGFATGGSWLCYYAALQAGVVSVVVPIDKMSILITVAFSWFFLHERLSKKAAVGLVLMAAATLTMALIG